MGGAGETLKIVDGRFWRSKSSNSIGCGGERLIRVGDATWWSRTLQSPCGSIQLAVRQGHLLLPAVLYSGAIS